MLSHSIIEDACTLISIHTIRADQCTIALSHDNVLHEYITQFIHGMLLQYASKNAMRGGECNFPKIALSSSCDQHVGNHIDESAIWGKKLHSNRKIARGEATCMLLGAIFPKIARKILVTYTLTKPNLSLLSNFKLTRCNFK